MAEDKFFSRDEVKQQKALEEARKAGTAPAEKDEEGRDINPHIPQYISKAPWYLNQAGPGLKHQRGDVPEKKTGLLADIPIQKGLKPERILRYRKGACENCGAATHKTRDCVERPRVRGAKITGLIIVLLYIYIYIK
eukprot:GHVR01171612.1.p1 GENE.GHVR01171612.1~~GHVR01171612.1.p1  ORF type:complete len:137 (+),score=42.55 GHVR01171612.1:65-475(+)